MVRKVRLLKRKLNEPIVHIDKEFLEYIIEYKGEIPVNSKFSKNENMVKKKRGGEIEFYVPIRYANGVIYAHVHFDFTLVDRYVVPSFVNKENYTYLDLERRLSKEISAKLNLKSIVNKNLDLEDIASENFYDKTAECVDYVMSELGYEVTNVFITYTKRENKKPTYDSKMKKDIKKIKSCLNSHKKKLNALSQGMKLLKRDIETALNYILNGNPPRTIDDYEKAALNLSKIYLLRNEIYNKKITEEVKEIFNDVLKRAKTDNFSQPLITYFTDEEKERLLLLSGGGKNEIYS